MRTILATTLLVGLCACNDDEDDGHDTFDTGLRDITETDVGFVCFDDQITDGSVTFTVSEDCLTGSAQDVELTCEATLDDEDHIVITSTLTYRVGSSQTDDCNVHTTTCSLDGLTGATYEVVYRNDDEPLTAAGDGSRSCLPEGYFEE